MGSNQYVQQDKGPFFLLWVLHCLSGNQHLWEGDGKPLKGKCWQLVCNRRQLAADQQQLEGNWAVFSKLKAVKETVSLQTALPLSDECEPLGRQFLARYPRLKTKSTTLNNPQQLINAQQH